MKRREMLKTGAAIAVAFAIGSTRTALAEPNEESIKKAKAAGSPWADQLGWSLGAHTYSFNRFTFEEAVKKNAAIGMRWCEVFPGQRLNGSGGNIGPDMTKEQKKTMRSILVDNGVVVKAIGVTGSGRRDFDFAAEMGIEIINSEPGFNQLSEVDKLCNEYKIKVGLHNHPKPSIHWDYKKTVEVLKDLGPFIGACCDTGHYMRSDLNPLEAVKALKGRIVSFHFKDLNKFGGDAHDVPWGTGQADVKAILKELADQKFRGHFSSEYEYNWDNSLPEIAESVYFFNQTAKEILMG